MKYFIIICISVCFSLATLGQDALHYKIKKIEFQTWSDWEACSFKLIINADKTVEYKADTTYCKPLISMHQTINKTAYDSLIIMLNQINFLELKDRYGYGFDCGGRILTVIYNNGKKKKVTVICGDEPKGLKDILHMLYELKDVEHWK